MAARPLPLPTAKPLVPSGPAAILAGGGFLIGCMPQTNIRVRVNADVLAIADQILTDARRLGRIHRGQSRAIGMHFIKGADYDTNGEEGRVGYGRQ